MNDEAVSSGNDRILAAYETSSRTIKQIQNHRINLKGRKINL